MIERFALTLPEMAAVSLHQRAAFPPGFHQQVDQELVGVFWTVQVVEVGKAIIERTRDKNTVVRQQATQALSHLKTVKYVNGPQRSLPRLAQQQLQQCPTS